MATTLNLKTKPLDSVQLQTATVQEPRRLSKAAIWRQNNPGGIFEVRDWRAVNK